MKTDKKLLPFFRSMAEWIPLLTFFVVYKIADIMTATFAMMLTTAIALGLLYTLDKKIAKLPLFSAGLLFVMGSITLLSGDSRFIKMKPTLIYGLFAVLLLGGVSLKRPLLKSVLGHAITLTEEAWLVFSKRMGWFFVGLAVLNEIIWRHFEEAFWIKFKVFGMAPLTLLFVLLQLPLLLRESRTTQAPE